MNAFTKPNYIFVVYLVWSLSTVHIKEIKVDKTEIL